MTTIKVYPKSKCPTCSEKFDLTRKDKKFCSEKCQKHSSRTTASRQLEYKKRNAEHYHLADRLTRMLNTLPTNEYYQLIQTILTTAACGYAKLRNVLLDPNLIEQSESVSRKVRVYCNTYLKQSTYDSILNSDRTYSKKNFLNSKITPFTRWDFPMNAVQAREFEELLADLSSWEKVAKAQPVYIPRPRDPNAIRSAPELEFVEILDNLPPLPQMEVIVSQHYSVDHDEVFDDDDDWDVEHQIVRVLENIPDDIVPDDLGNWHYRNCRFSVYNRAKWYKDSILKYQKQAA